MSKARDLANAGTALGAVTATELAYVDGVTSAIQTQIDTKAPSSTAVTLTGTQTLTNKTLTNPVIASVVNNTLTSTTGDMIYASAANTPARLAIGSTDQVLKVTGGVPAWATPAAGGAGNMVQIATGTLSGASVQITGLSSYTDILFLITGATNNTANGEFIVRINSTSTDHSTFGSFWNGSSFTNGTNFSGDTNFYLAHTVNPSRTSALNVYTFKLTNCKNAGFTDIDIVSSYRNADIVPGAFFAKGVYTKSEAVSTVDLKNNGGTWSAGTYTVWGA